MSGLSLRMQAEIATRAASLAGTAAHAGAAMTNPAKASHTARRPVMALLDGQAGDPLLQVDAFPAHTQVTKHSEQQSADKGSHHGDGGIREHSIYGHHHGDVGHERGHHESD